MDSKNSIINKITQFLSFMNEDFIISLSNKGTYKRSLKDLDKMDKKNISVSLTDNEDIQIKLEDNTVTLNQNIQKSVCSCPSQGVCKHITMSLLYLKEFYEENKEVEAEEMLDNEKTLKNEDISIENKMENSEISYRELEELTAEKLLEILGKKTYNSLINSLFLRNDATFEYGEMLCVNIENQNVKIYFPKKNSLENAVCSCKENKICRHKAYALMAYLMKSGKITRENLEQEKIEIGEKESEILKNLKMFVISLFDRGISGLIETDVSQAEKFYIQTYGIKLFLLAQDLQNVSSELNSYFSKNISFSETRLMHFLCNIYNRIDAILAIKNQEKLAILAGKRQEEKFNLSSISLFGLGTTPVITKRNDLLLTAYFYCDDIDQILSMSTLRPYEYPKQAKSLFNIGQIWSNELSFKEVSGARLILKNARISMGKVSLTKQSASRLKGITSLANIEKIAICNYKDILENLHKKKFDYFQPVSPNKNIFLVKVSKTEDIFYDEIFQKLRFSCFDKFNSKIDFEINYSSINESIIKYFEREKDNLKFDYVLGNIFEKNGNLSGKFLNSITDGKIENLFFK
ncbi:SWIM zinc finger family protein [Leptotrichia sp. HSP-536]|uniref:SWIM zinc finger family protein n=1 Tax=Leptotrichia alba TaxID=3239304 RepID=A0AB39V6H8_9FUSO